MFETHRHNSDSIEDHTTEFIELTSPVFNELHDDFVVNQQPQSNSNNIRTDDDQRAEFRSRRQIPISTIDWQSTNSLQVIANHGIDFLRNIDQIYIQQTVELSDLMSNVRSENRYKVIIPHGETLFYATEESSERQRMFCGSNRGFQMHLFDRSQQEALLMKRSTTFGCCSFWCKMQKMELFMPNNQFIGEVKQIFTLTVPTFVLCNMHGSIVYRIEGPSSFIGAMKEAHFGIYSNDGLMQLGSINHQWDQLQNEYNIAITFPSGADDPKNKALIMGVAFLLEYMFFFHTKTAGTKCCC